MSIDFELRPYPFMIGAGLGSQQFRRPGPYPIEASMVQFCVLDFYKAFTCVFEAFLLLFYQINGSPDWVHFNGGGIQPYNMQGSGF